MKKLFKLITVLALVLAMLLSTAAFAARSAKVISASMKVYKSKKVSVGSLARGTKISVLKTKGSWIKFKYKGGTYYGKTKCVMFLKGTPAVTTKDAYFEFVTKKSYHSGTYYKATLAAGTKVYIVGTNGKKYLVKSADGKAMGYLAKTAVQKK